MRLWKRLLPKNQTSKLAYFDILLKAAIIFALALSFVEVLSEERKIKELQERITIVESAE